ncbi:polysaccharide deacetylase family protein [candidate division NPL-UPA2 bacterium]|nr:polysaccharide deacetylase family protein [candidate division NPL-UPA2 bacterium]
MMERRNQAGIIYWHGDTGSHQVALTFDDGPNEPYTSQILDILDEYAVKATFFMVGRNVENFPETARKVKEAGHVIGNHTYSHRGPILNTPPRVANEISKAEDVIQKVTSISPYLFRPPYGAVGPRVLRQVERLGYVVSQWSVNAGDWRGASPQKIKKRVLSQIEDGAIVLMHDGRNLSAGHDRSSTVAALPEIILSLQDRGYKLVTLPELLKLDSLENFISKGF